MTDEQLVKEMQEKLEELNSLAVAAHNRSIVVDIEKIPMLINYTIMGVAQNPANQWRLVAKIVKHLTHENQFPHITYP